MEVFKGFMLISVVISSWSTKMANATQTPGADQHRLTQTTLRQLEEERKEGTLCLK